MYTQSLTNGIRKAVSSPALTQPVKSLSRKPSSSSFSSSHEGTIPTILDEGANFVVQGSRTAATKLTKQTSNSFLPASQEATISDFHGFSPMIIIKRNASDSSFLGASKIAASVIAMNSAEQQVKFDGLQFGIKAQEWMVTNEGTLKGLAAAQPLVTDTMQKILGAANEAVTASLDIVTGIIVGGSILTIATYDGQNNIVYGEGRDNDQKNQNIAAVLDNGENKENANLSYNQFTEGPFLAFSTPEKSWWSNLISTHENPALNSENKACSLPLSQNEAVLSGDALPICAMFS